MPPSLPSKTTLNNNGRPRTPQQANGNGSQRSLSGTPTNNRKASAEQGGSASGTGGGGGMKRLMNMFGSAGGRKSADVSSSRAGTPVKAAI
jgi:hypothetical protein